jgi:hypothetical protein
LQAGSEEFEEIRRRGRKIHLGFKTKEEILNNIYPGFWENIRKI